MMAFPNFQTFDLGAAASTGEQVKGQRLRNALGGQVLAENRETKAKRDKLRQVRAQTENAGEAIRQLRADGMHEQADQLADQQRKQFTSTISMIDSVSQWVTDQESYDTLRTAMLREGAIEPEDMPPTYSKSFFPALRRKTRGKMSTFNRVVGVSDEGVRSMTQVTQDSKGNVLAQSQPFDSREDLAERRQREQGRRQLALAGRREKRLSEPKADGGPALKPSVSNSVRSSVASALDGIYDITTGRIQFKDDATRRRAKQVEEDAERMLISGEQASVNAAVAAALRRAGIPIPDTNQMGDDPLGILGQ